MSRAYNSQMHVAVGGAWQRAGLRLMRQIELPSDYQALDAGCGSGDLTFALARSVPDGRVVGFDSNARLIAAAQATAKQQGVPNVTFEEADLFTFEPGQTFDLVFCNSTLHVVRPGVEAVVRLASWVKPGGKLALQLPARDLSEEVQTAITEGLAAIGEPLPFPTWSSPWFLPAANELAKLARDAGIETVRAMEELEPLSFRSPEDAAAYFSGLLLEPYFERIPPEKHADFLDAFGESFPLENGMPTCLLKRLYLIGKR